MLGCVERTDRLRRPVERWIVGRHTDVRQHARDLSLDCWTELCCDQGTDLRLRLRDGEPER